MKKIPNRFTLFFFASLVFAVDGRLKNDQKIEDPFRVRMSAKIGDYPFPSNPMSDRAKGFIDQGRVKSAVTNYGSFINWDTHPAGIWGDYSYLPAVSFIAAIPGHKNTASYNDWYNLETIVDDEGFPLYSIWESTKAYDDWYPANGDTTFKGVLFELGEDDGIYNPNFEKLDLESIDSEKQYYFNHEDRKIVLTTFGDKDPSKTSTRIGFIYPWALRPALISRESQFDFYDYGEDLEEWTSDDITFITAQTRQNRISLVRIIKQIGMLLPCLEQGRIRLSTMPAIYLEIPRG